MTFDSGALGLIQRSSGSAVHTFTRTPEGEAVGLRAGQRHYYIHDHLGSVVGVFSATGSYSGGYACSPYGEARFTGTNGAVVANTLRYIAGHHEGGGIYKLGARYYDTTLGRFTQMDPTGQEANPYTYANLDPINLSDPTGLLVRAILGAAIEMAGLVGLGLAIASGDQRQIAIEAVKVGVGALTGVACAGIIAGVAALTVGYGAIAGIAVCYIASELVSSATVAFN